MKQPPPKPRPGMVDVATTLIDDVDQFGEPFVVDLSDLEEPKRDQDEPPPATQPKRPRP